MAQGYMNEFQASLRSAKSGEDLAALIDGGGGDGGPVAWGDVTGKPTEFPPADHQHAAGDIASGTLAIGRIPTGTSGTTVALGNHTHANLATTDALSALAARVQALEDAAEG
ncbi:hypothetical protein KGD82_16350 [Nocardiopsis eucommiae]|uniref:Uncharacterized protein n=1 Tax=Nocardiopsis eucommiae TaxID=2831970 RepID=A0A975QJD0_9ACTN|nr:hypothetical protein KGD82_16350 [Nocardiopsis eucommiae]